MPPPRSLQAALDEVLRVLPEADIRPGTPLHSYIDSCVRAGHETDIIRQSELLRSYVTLGTYVPRIPMQITPIPIPAERPQSTLRGAVEDLQRAVDNEILQSIETSLYAQRFPAEMEWRPGTLSVGNAVFLPGNARGTIETQRVEPVIREATEREIQNIDFSWVRDPTDPHARLQGNVAATPAIDPRTGMLGPATTQEALDALSALQRRFSSIGLETPEEVRRRNPRDATEEFRREYMGAFQQEYPAMNELVGREAWRAFEEEGATRVNPRAAEQYTRAYRQGAPHYFEPSYVHSPYIPLGVDPTDLRGIDPGLMTSTNRVYAEAQGGMSREEMEAIATILRRTSWERLMRDDEDF